tara:strand:+ start:2129 stop:2566 length:438 start_codon:yes stop_codon:yes gene_type:complete
MKLKIKKTNSEAQLPKQANSNDACFDLYACNMETTERYIQYDTGIGFDIPKGYVGLVFARSSSSNYDLALSNGVGVIDHGYQDSVKFRFRRHPIKAFGQELPPKVYGVGDRIGQIMVIPRPQLELEVVEEFDTEDRGGGWGSSGV